MIGLGGMGFNAGVPRPGPAGRNPKWATKHAARGGETYRQSVQGRPSSKSDKIMGSALHLVNAHSGFSSEIFVWGFTQWRQVAGGPRPFVQTTIVCADRSYVTSQGPRLPVEDAIRHPHYSGGRERTSLRGSPRKCPTPPLVCFPPGAEGGSITHPLRYADQ
jgi:hypothetical protein